MQQRFSSSLFILYIDVFAHWRGGEVRDSEDRESHNGLKIVLKEHCMNRAVSRIQGAFNNNVHNIRGRGSKKYLFLSMLRV